VQPVDELPVDDLYWEYVMDASITQHKGKSNVQFNIGCLTRMFYSL
jgi:hypothetical protein